MPLTRPDLRPDLLPDLLPDLAHFAQAQLQSQDMDPAYPVLRYLVEHATATEEEALWLLLVYVAYYNLPSAWAVFQAMPRPDLVPGDLARLPTGTERRGLRGGAPMQQHLHHLAYIHRVYGHSFRAWLRSCWSDDPALDWSLVQETIQEAHGNGRWAAYKTAELLQKVLDWPLVPTDMGNAFSSGPRAGLALFFNKVEGNSPAAIKQLDLQGLSVQSSLKNYGAALDLAQVETALCDFHALHDGRYYVGHDIDQMQEQISRSPVRSEANPIWLARSRTLPHAYLGELGGWSGVDTARKRLYRDRGTIATRTP